MADISSPVFIVGAPRSGTTLLATLLSSHSQISCGPETHFFPYLEANYSRLGAVLREAAWPEQAAEFVARLDLEGYPVHELFNVRTEAIVDYLATQQPSLSALLESLTVPHMQVLSKTRWAEKTPNHLLHLAAIRRLYPTAKIVRIVRDPRDSALSMAAKLPWASPIALVNAYLIAEWHRKSQPFWARDAQSLTLRYEDLVTHPVGTLQQLCEFVQVPFEVTMLDTRAAAQHTAPQHESWKEQVAQGLDASRCGAWQHQPTTVELEAISAVCHELIQAFGYPPLATNLRPIQAHYVSDRFARSHAAALAHLLQQGSVLVPCDPAQVSVTATVLYCDVPISGDNWGKSLRKFRHFCIELVYLRLKGVSVQFSGFSQSSQADRNRWGYLAAWLLRQLGQSTPVKGLG